MAFIADIGPCNVYWGGTLVGASMDDTIVRISSNYADSHRSNKGTLAVDSVISGHTVEVETPMGGLTLTQMSVLFPNSVLNGNTSKLEFKTSVGYSMKDNAAALVLKPILSGTETTDQRNWITFNEAHPVPNWEVPFGSESERIYNIMWRVFDDDNDVMVQFGASGSAGG